MDQNAKGLQAATKAREKERLAAALRDNLKRRKEQGRSQKSPNKAESTSETDQTN